MVVLETLEGARKRGAEIIGEIVGFGMSADAADLTNPDIGGMARGVQACLDDGGIASQDVDYINAHGTGTAANDTAETAALKATFGDQASKIPISSTKSMVGHALGAAGALEFIAILLAARENVAPPDGQLSRPRPGLRPRLCSRRSQAAQDRPRGLQFIRVWWPQRRACGGQDALSGSTETFESKQACR